MLVIQDSTHIHGNRTKGSLDEALDGSLVYGENGVYDISGPPGGNAAKTVFND